MEIEGWRIEVTDADIRTAKRAWIAARDGLATDARVEQLYDDLRALVHAQAQQIADDFRASAQRSPGPVGAEPAGTVGTESD